MGPTGRSRHAAWVVLACAVVLAVSVGAFASGHGADTTVGVSVLLVDEQSDWQATSLTTCQAFNGATGLEGTTVEFVDTDDDTRARFRVNGPFELQHGRFCDAGRFFVQLLTEAGDFQVRTGHLPAASLTRAQLKDEATSDALAGFAILISNCSRQCTVVIKLVVEPAVQSILGGYSVPR